MPIYYHLIPPSTHATISIFIKYDDDQKLYRYNDCTVLREEHTHHAIPLFDIYQVILNDIVEAYAVIRLDYSVLYSAVIITISNNGDRYTVHLHKQEIIIFSKLKNNIIINLDEDKWIRLQHTDYSLESFEQKRHELHTASGC